MAPRLHQASIGGETMSFSKARIFVTSAALLLCSSLALANAAVNSSTTLVQRPKKDASIFSGFLVTNRSTGLYDFKDGTREDGMDYTVRLNTNLTPDYTLRVDTGYTQNLKDSEKNTMADTLMTFRRNPFKVGKTFLFGYNLGGTAPTSKDSSKRQNMQGSARAGVILAINPDRLVKGFAIASLASVSRNFHQYETDVMGKVLNQYSSTQELTISYDFPVGISISADLLHLNAISYQGAVVENYQMVEEISYQFNSVVSAAIGHSNSGSALRPNGQDYSFDMYNENSSVVYASMTLVF
jgi:hypothetical protein